MMSQSEQIIEKIVATMNAMDNQQLKEVHKFVQDFETGAVFDFSPEEESMVRQAIAQVEDGNYLSENESRLALKECIEKSLSQRLRKAS